MSPLRVPDVPVLSYSPVVLPVPGRPVDLQLRVTAPAEGSGLPVILLSHGHGGSNNLSSLNGYAPLANAWAAQGFVVIQPTHLSSRTLIPEVGELPGAPLFWRSRAEDMTAVLDRLDVVEKTVPLLAGRVDHAKVGVAGHSLGGFTASLLLGARVTVPGADSGSGSGADSSSGSGPESESDEIVDLTEPRIKAGVLLAAPGRGGDALNGPRIGLVPFFSSVDFGTMTAPALVVAGDRDDSRHFTDVGPSWHADPYTLAPGPKTLLTLFGAEHGLGGIAGYDVAETTDENPERVAAVAWLSAAYLRSQLFAGDDAWQTACDALTSGPDAFGRVDSK